MRHRFPRGAALTLAAAFLAGCETPSPLAVDPSDSPAVLENGIGPSAFTATPINELTTTYFGLSGYFYDHSNTPPPEHDSLGAIYAAAIEPLSVTGAPLEPSLGGRVVFLSMGYSNTSGKFCQRGIVDGVSCNPWSFEGKWKTSSQLNQPANGLQVFNGATKGGTTAKWDDPADPDYGIVYDALTAYGLSPLQVQVVYAELALANPTIGLPNFNSDMYNLVRMGGAQMRAMKVRYPNVRQAFISPRDYAGYSKGTLSREPFAYESAFAAKWLVQAQLTQIATGVIDTLAGDLSLAVAPWLTWGPYLWASGTPRADGLFWLPTNYDAKDGVHFSTSGETKAAGLMIDFFSLSPYSRCWFVKGLSCTPGGSPPPQFARPATLVSNPGGWVAMAGTQLWDMLDESAADDASSMTATSGGPSGSPGNTFTVGLAPVTDPHSSTGHVIHLRGRKPQAGKRVEGAVELMDGNRVIATLSIADLAAVNWTDYSYSLSPAEADAISGYGGLSLRITMWSAGAGTNRLATVTQAYLETPGLAP